MNGHDEKSRLSEDDFGAKGSIVSAFDAFPKSKPQYVERTSGGGKWTVTIIVISIFLFWTELARWWRGAEDHTFAVEKGVGHDLQINIDTVVKMKCADLHVNVQDASGDHIQAAAKLKKEPTSWMQWVDKSGMHKLGQDPMGRIITHAGYDLDEGFGEEHVHDILGQTKRKGKWAKTPKIKGRPDSCRMFGSLDLNKVQGDFHITARGHGYTEWGAQHLDHKNFNFSHIVNEFSFGPFYPSLVNPLDRTVNLASNNFHKFQYFISVVPTVYSVGRKGHGASTVSTNQFAVTEQSKEIDERTIPGIFVKYDIEPIQLSVEETRAGFLQFLLKLVNVLSGVMVAGHWGFTLSEWAREVMRKRRARSQGFIGTGKGDYES